MYNKVWYHINNNGIIKNKAINKNEINKYEQLGWIKGRYLTNYKNSKWYKVNK